VAGVGAGLLHDAGDLQLVLVEEAGAVRQAAVHDGAEAAAAAWRLLVGGRVRPERRQVHRRVGPLDVAHNLQQQYLSLEIFTSWLTNNVLGRLFLWYASFFSFFIFFFRLLIPFLFHQLSFFPVNILFGISTDRNNIRDVIFTRLLLENG